MKKITFLYFLCILYNISFSQGTDVLSAEQFCSGTSSLTFNNIYGGSDNTSVGCLGTIPNAAYFYIEIDQPGDLIFNISQQNLANNPIDVDFIVWGPFTDLTDADNSISLTTCTCPSNTANPNFYPYLDTAPNPDSPIMDCSYSFNATETMNIQNALQGEVYVAMITNFDGSQGTIDFSQISGTGTATCASATVCGSNFYDSGGAGSNYSNNESYLTTINPYFAGGTVNVDFTSFNIGSGDILSVYNGPNNTFPLLGTVTGAPSTFTSTTVGNPTGAITFEFTSDGSNVSSGWEADITCTSPPTPPVCGTTYYDNGGSSSNYANNEYITTTYYPDTPGDALTATFNSFSTETSFDELYIFDGPNTASPLLGVFSGSTIPGPFTSSDPSGALTFLFDSDSSITYPGWSVSMSCAPYVAPVVCGSTIYDSGGASGNYGNNQLITTTLTPDVANTAIVATFTAFDLENNYDYLEIFDGPNNTFPSLGIYTGNTIPGPFTSSHPSGSLTLEFDSDGSIVYSGYAIDITCINNCNLVITDTNYPIGADNCNLDYIELTTNALPPAPSTVIFSETFNSGTFPTGWNAVNGASSAQWIISNTNNAGGAANEAMLDWTTGGHNSTWRLNSPAIDITGQTNIHLSFDHDLWQFDSGFSIYLETSLNNTTWTTQYSVANPPGDITETRNVDLSSLDGNNTMYLRFRFSGDSFDIFHWAIDNIVVTADSSPSQPQITWSPLVDLFEDSALTIPYSGGYLGTVYAAPNGTQNYTATDINGCTDLVTVTNNKKTWNGSAGNTDWSTASNWIPTGVPIETNCITIVDTSGNDPIIDSATDGLGYNITIQNGATLTQQSNSTLTIVNTVNVEAGGTYNIEDSSSLIQVDNVANIVDGSFNMVRNTNIRQNDYVYWSSPVNSFNIENVSPATPNGYKHEWIPTLFQGIGPPGNMLYGQWQNYDTGVMDVGKGYIVRGPSGYSNTPTAFTATFSGTPNNGSVAQPIQRGIHLSGPYSYQPYAGGDILNITNDDDNWNLIGNPYPSAIDAIDFLTNPSNINISGNVYLWTHDSDLGIGNGDPFYQDYVYNYNIADYLAYNSSGTSMPSGFNGYIGAGQGFFVLMTDAATISETVTFENSMRDSSYANNQFYRISNDENNTSTAHRIWLDYINPSGLSNTALIAYVDGATNSEDRMYDATTPKGNGLDLYSLIDDKAYVIQGRQLPFENSDQVPIGLYVTETGTQTIAINTLQGLFQEETQDIYLEDLTTGVIHNLKNSPYTFTSSIGFIDDRFMLRYTNNSLGIDDLKPTKRIKVYEENNEIIVSSEFENIQSIEVYDVLGRKLFNNSSVNRNQYSINAISPNNLSLFLKIRLVDGSQKIVKIIF